MVRRQDLRPTMVDGDDHRRLAALAQVIRPERRIGDGQEASGQLGQCRAEVTARRQQVDQPGHGERWHRDDRRLGHLGRPKLRRRLDGRVRHGEQHRLEVDLRVGGPDRLAAGGELLDRDVLEDQERVVGHVEDVRDPVLPGPDRSPRDQRIGVQGELIALELVECRIHRRGSSVRAPPGRASATRAAYVDVASRRSPIRPVARVIASRAPSPGARRRAAGSRAGA